MGAQALSTGISTICATRMTTRKEKSSPAIGRMIRRTGRRTGSVAWYRKYWIRDSVVSGRIRNQLRIAYGNMINQM